MKDEKLRAFCGYGPDYYSINLRISSLEARMDAFRSELGYDVMETILPCGCCTEVVLSKSRRNKDA
jgi:hypothetical protein